MNKGLSIAQKLHEKFTAINEVRKCIYSILGDIIVFFYQSGLCIEALTG